MKCAKISWLVFYICLFGCSAVKNTPTSYGECYANIYPEGDLLRSNNLLMLYGRCVLIEKIKQGEEEIYLVSDKRKIKLEVVHTLQGDSISDLFYKVFLRPVKKLHANEEVSLELKRKNRMGLDIPKLNDKRWEVLVEVDTVAPRWLALPKAQGGRQAHMEHFGTSSYIRYKLRIADKSSVLVQAQVWDKTSGEIQSDLLPINERYEIKVGLGGNHSDGSYGAITFQKGHGYAIRFRLMDLSGNFSARWTDWQPALNPYEMDNQLELDEDFKITPISEH